MRLFGRPPQQQQSLFRRGEFTLASGKRAGWKIECDALTDNDWLSLAYMLAAGLPEFGSVHGVPRGGLKLAQVLEVWVEPTSELRLVVDDVWTTGGSMNRFIDTLPKQDTIGAVVFARGWTPTWVLPMFRMARRGSIVTRP